MNECVFLTIYHQHFKLEAPMKSTLSTLWLFILLNVLFRDLHDLFRPGAITEIETGTINGTQISNELLLFAAFVIEIPILMVLLSKILHYKINRRLNIVIPPLLALSYLHNGVRDLDDVFFMAIVLLALLCTSVLAWRWQANTRV
ncbi:DUF6326 family protein [Agaribacterium sp. ZY112]|uniref:DUF6326 family protein n=1 Tax=Agaribacterium sp. ZY112 TaxID=3233574 RepID=UPI003525A18F